MKNRCSYCEATDKDVVCWECLESMLDEIREQVKELNRKFDNHMHPVAGLPLLSFPSDCESCGEPAE